MNAYELANELSEFMTEDEYIELDKTIFKAVTMLRQQADRIAELEKLTREPTKVFAVPDLMAKAGFFKRKPLSDEEIQVLINDVPDYDIGIYELFQFARAIEERHGIK